MTNPFTKFLSQWFRDPDLEAFVARWDELEMLMVQVYKEKASPAEAADDFARVWPWLRRHYGQWEGALRPYWQQTKAAGEMTQTDPFALLLAFEKPADILGDWRAMQHLPAAREALNLYIRDQGEGGA